MGTRLAEVVIASAARTAVGRFRGALRSAAATELGETAVRGALAAVGGGVAAGDVSEVYMGNVLSADLGQAPARQAARAAGLPDSAVCTTVNKVCASGMKAVQLAAQSIALGHHEVAIAGGMESMSRVPYYLPQARAGYEYGHGTMLDGILRDGLLDVAGWHMGMAGEQTAAELGITRTQQDEYAALSYKRALAATASEAFRAELVPVTLKDGTTVAEDEEPRRIDFDKIPKLRPVFKRDGGCITAANSSKLSDGAAALLLLSAARARAVGTKPLARIVGYGDGEKAPMQFPTAPELAIQVALQRAGLKTADIDLWEINEAFASVVLANMQLLDLDIARVNVNGGAISLGHPLGMSGARIVVALAHELRRRGRGRLGCAAVCNGGGGASAIVIESL